MDHGCELGIKVLASIGWTPEATFSRYLFPGRLATPIQWDKIKWNGGRYQLGLNPDACPNTAKSMNVMSMGINHRKYVIGATIIHETLRKKATINGHVRGSKLKEKPAQVSATIFTNSLQ